MLLPDPGLGWSLKLYDLVRGFGIPYDGTLKASTTVPSLTFAPNGFQALDFAVSGARVVFDTFLDVSNSSCSITTYLQPHDISTSFKTILRPGLQSSSWAVGIYNDGLAINIGGSTLTMAAGTSALADEGWSVATFAIGDSPNVQGWIDGIATGTRTNTLTTPSGAYGVIGSLTDGASSVLNSSIGCLITHSRPLSAWEVAELAKEIKLGFPEMLVRDEATALDAGVPIPVFINHYRQQGIM